MQIYAVYREGAKPHEKPIVLTTSYEVARRRAKEYPTLTKIVGRVIADGYGDHRCRIFGQLRCYQYRGQNAWVGEPPYIAPDQSEPDTED